MTTTEFFNKKHSLLTIASKVKHLIRNGCIYFIRAVTFPPRQITAGQLWEEKSYTVLTVY